MNNNWRPGRIVLWIWTGFGIRARLGLHLFCLCRLRTGRNGAYIEWLDNKLIVTANNKHT